MATTPPPRSRRVHTPPAPRLGLSDEWTPFTPRRSNRVAAQRSQIAQTPQHGLLQPPSIGISAVSPPSSPVSPSHPHSHSKSSSKPIKRSAPSPRKQKSRLQAGSGSETEIEPSRLRPTAVLPTPLKTPKKKELSRESLSSTSRVLFHQRLATVEDAMPTPKKNRRRAYSLDPLAGMGATDEKIEVYEDSKERVPTADFDEENPFLVASSASRPSRPRAKSARDRSLESSIKNDEGVVYVFRGKKIFRKFDGDDEDDNLSDLDIRRRAGVDSMPRPSRTSLKPKILFPTEAQLRNQEEAAAEEAEEADEEALTDIEVPYPSARAKTVSNKKSQLEKPEPVIILDDTTETVQETDQTLPETIKPDDESPQITNKRLAGTKRSRPSSPFDAWSRTKPLNPSSSEARTTKRQGSPLEKTSKRVRSSSVTVPP